MTAPKNKLTEMSGRQAPAKHDPGSPAASYPVNPSATLSGEAKQRYVSGMFARIASRYDFMNALMSFGQDASWRRFTAKQARVMPGNLALDVATGTGRIADELARRGAHAVGIDFSAEMMLSGRSQGVGRGRDVFLVGADALMLPFADNTFDCVTTGFAMRNVVDIESAFREACRVVKPGGRVVCLEVGRPNSSITRVLHSFYTLKIVPLLGRWLVGDADAYTYLPNSMRRFPPPAELAELMVAAGLSHVRFRQLTFGAVAVHTAIKPGK